MQWLRKKLNLDFQLHYFITLIKMNAMVDVVVTTINLGAVSVSFLFLSCIPLTTIFIFVFAIIQLETVFITRVNAKHKDVCGDSTCKFRGVVSCDSVSTENEKRKVCILLRMSVRS